MILSNPLYSYIYEFSNKLNEAFKNYSFKNNYNFSEKDNFFICYNIKTSILKEELVIKDISFEGYLAFEVNDATEELTITKIPYILINGLKIPFFTSNIIQIIIEKTINKGQNLRIKFVDPLCIFVIDNDADSLISSIRNTSNYNNINNIKHRITLELKKINQLNENYNRHLKRQEIIEERIYKQRRMYHGLNPEEFSSLKEMQEKELEIRIGKLEKQIEKAKRHILTTKEAYKRLLGKHIDILHNGDTPDDREEIIEEWYLNDISDDKGLFKVYNLAISHYCNSYIWRQLPCFVLCTLYKYYYKDFRIIDMKGNITEKNYNEADDILSSSLQKHPIIENEISKIRDAFWTVDYCAEYPHFYSEPSPCQHKNYLVDSYWASAFYDVVDDYYKLDTVKALDYIIQIKVLEVKVKKLSAELEKCIKCKEPSAGFTSILDIPVFYAADKLIECRKNIKGDSYDKWNWLFDSACEPDFYTEILDKHPKNMIMTKPGTTQIDSIINVEHEKAYVENLEEKDDIDSSHLIFIADSLDNESISLLCKNIFTKPPFFDRKIFVCENVDSYIKIKKNLYTIFLKYLKNKPINFQHFAYGHGEDTYADTEEDSLNMIFHSSTYLTIDPNYYFNYFRTLPKIEELYKNYYFTGNYKNKITEQNLLTVESLFYIYAYRYIINNYQNTGTYDYVFDSLTDEQEKEFFELALGSYDSSNNNDIPINQLKYAAIWFYKMDFYSMDKASTRKKEDLVKTFLNNDYDSPIAQKVLEANKIYLIKEKDNMIYKVSYYEEKYYKYAAYDDNYGLCFESDDNYLIWKNFPYLDDIIIKEKNEGYSLLENDDKDYKKLVLNAQVEWEGELPF